MDPYASQLEARPDPGRLWAAGAATAVVAALAALVGILIARTLAHVAILAPEGDGAWGDASTVVYVVLAAVCGLLATGLLHFLMATTPRAATFFGWIMGLLIVVAIVIPLGLVVNMDDKLATAALNLLIGLAVTVPLYNVANMLPRRTRRIPPETPVPPVDRPEPTREWNV